MIPVVFFFFVCHEACKHGLGLSTTEKGHTITATTRSIFDYVDDQSRAAVKEVRTGITE